MNGRGRLLRGRIWLLAGVSALAVLCATAGVASANPPTRVSPFAHGHHYRHGVVPPRASTGTASSTNNLSYGGGINGVGVTTAPPRVYLVFWGSQWGTPSTDAQGNVTLSGDGKGMAPYVQKFIKGLGTDNELWSGVMTQYCQGVSAGAQTCPASNTSHVGHPSGDALAGVWVDESSAAPAQATASQIGAEAVSAATHFGNTTQSSNLPAQYVIVSPSGTHPDGFHTSTGQFCAWHDYTGDVSVSSPDGQLAFTNLPYITDMGTRCGQNFVNSGSTGTLDGVSIVEGHEYAETVTDQFPAGGWTDASGNEDGDKCAWISPGTQGGAANLSLATGTFAVQATWGNDYSGGAGGCEISHAIVSNGTGSNTVSVTNPGNQTTTVGSSVNLQIQATDSGGAALTYTAAGLPAGLSINSSTGLISGSPTSAATASVTVTAKDSTGASGSTSFTWTVSSPGSGGCTAKQLLGNPGFETGSASPWSMTAGVLNNSSGQPAHSGSWDAWLDGYGTTHTDTLAQTVSIPSGCTNYTLGFWLHIDTAETTSTTAYDTLKVQVLSSSGGVLATLATYSNLNHASGYVQHTFNVAAYAGQTVTLKFTGSEDYSLQTSFVIDDTALNVS